LRLRSPSARDAIRTTSDITSVASVLITVGVDSLLVPALRGKGDVGWQMLVVDAEAFAMSGLLTSSTYFSVGRARPSYDDCRKNPNFDPLCRSGATTSFWSGHTTVAFTAAGLSCAHHVYLHIYGDGLADVLGCAGMITMASATGMFRVMGDRHFATDILPGMIVGFGFGYGVATLLHYARAGDSGREAILITPSAEGFGLALSGTF
jgi:membrane-associated phospholipid phosphatase